MNPRRSPHPKPLRRRVATSCLCLALALAACDDGGDDPAIDVVDTSGEDTASDTTTPPTDTADPEDTTTPGDTQDATDTSEPGDTSDATDTLEPTDTADATDATDTSDASDTTDTTDTTDVSDAVDMTDTVDPCEGISQCAGVGQRCVDNAVVTCVADAQGCFVVDTSVAANDCTAQNRVCAVVPGTALCVFADETDCDDEIDNDDDGQIDCADVECAFRPECRVETCDNGTDDDADGAVDCGDPDCVDALLCADTEEHCFNSTDDDGDGLVDCNDPYCVDVPNCAGSGTLAACQSSFSCASDGACLLPLFTCDGAPHCADGSDEAPLNPSCSSCEPWKYTCGDGTCITDFFACDAIVLDGAISRWGGCPDGSDEILALCQPERCDNGRNDDYDGLIDCEDPDCLGDIACRPVPDGWSCPPLLYGDGTCDCGCSARDIDCASLDVEECGNCDSGCGSSDCSDIKPSLNPVCVGSDEICNNGFSDDNDFLADCLDSDCDSDPACLIIPVAEDCSDGIDNDQDGKTDCLDVQDCSTAPGCLTTSEDCDNGQDDDGDFQRDCYDPDCGQDAACAAFIQEVCWDTRDNDGNGLVDCHDPECVGYPLCNEPLIDPGDVIFNELGFYGTTAYYIELLNISGETLELIGCRIVDTEVNHVILEFFGSELIDDDPFLITRTTDIFMYPAYSWPTMNFRESGQTVALVCGDQVIDELTWDPSWQDSVLGINALQLSPASTSAMLNDTLANWCVGSTPGAPNSCP